MLKNQLHTLEKSKLTHSIAEGNVHQNEVSPQGLPVGSNKGDAIGTQTLFNFSDETKKQLEKSEGVPESDLSIITHEMRHQYDYDIGNRADNTKYNDSNDPMEIRAVHNENRARKLEGLPERTTYGQGKIDPKKLKNPPNNKNIKIKG